MTCCDERGLAPRVARLRPMRPVRTSSCKPVRADELLEGVDLLRRADQLEDDRVGAEIGDARAEHLGERHQLRALARAAPRP